MWPVHSRRQTVSIRSRRWHGTVHVNLVLAQQLVNCLLWMVQVRVWGPKSGVSKVSITMSDSPVTCLDVSADSSLVLGGCADGTVSLVNIESGKVAVLGTDCCC